jgi:hypothetical protein
VVTVLAGSGQSLDRWTNLAAAALGNVREQLPAGLGIPWNGSVVIEVPATQRDFESVLGKPAGNYTSIAAVTHHAGARGAGIRIVANPKAAQLTSAHCRRSGHEMVLCALPGRRIRLRRSGRRKGWPSGWHYEHIRASEARVPTRC